MNSPDIEGSSKVRLLAFKSSVIYLSAFYFSICLVGPASIQDADAASFDCRKASRATEILICRDNSLSALDSRLGEAFLAAYKKQLPSIRRNFLRAQHKWLSERELVCSMALANVQDANDSAKRIGCLLAETHKRIAFLENTLERSGSAPEKTPAERSKTPTLKSKNEASSEGDLIRTSAGIIARRLLKGRECPDVGDCQALFLNGKMIAHDFLIEISRVIPSKANPELIIYMKHGGGNCCSPDYWMLDVSGKQLRKYYIPSGPKGLPLIEQANGKPGVFYILGYTGETDKFGDPILANFTYDRSVAAIWQVRTGTEYDYSVLIGKYPADLTSDQTARKPLLSIMKPRDFVYFRGSISVQSKMTVSHFRYLVGQGCRPHACNEEMAIFVIDMLNDQAVALVRGKRIRGWGVIGEKMNDSAVRQILNSWLKQFSLKLNSKSKRVSDVVEIR